jgi:hypothetical protein
MFVTKAFKVFLFWRRGGVDLLLFGAERVMHLARFTTPPTAYHRSHVIKMVALAPELETKMAGTGLVMLSFVIWPSILDTGLFMQIATHENSR